LRFRGHLDNINNIDWCCKRIQSKQTQLKPITGTYDAVPVLLAYKAAGILSAVGDHNYGEGSSREHAAMEPRFLGVKVAVAKITTVFTKQILRNKVY
jgi:aconitate hydratase